MIGDKASATYKLAVELRCSLLSNLGNEATCAMLRLLTRHGRLYPGPPEIGPGAVNSEAKEVTPKEEVERMLGVGVVEVA